MGQVTMRDEIVEFLRKELIGPSPGLPFVQLNREEVLAPNSSPRIRYGAGILFPSELLSDEQEDTEDTPVSEEANSDVDEQEFLPEATGESDPRADERGDSQNETDPELNRSNEFLPSALGITAYVRLPETVCITIAAAQYHIEEVDGYGYKKAWFRTPIEERIILNSDRLISAGTVVEETHIEAPNDGCRLVLHVVSRPSSLVPHDERDRFVTFALVNRTLKEDLRPKDEDCFFQVNLSVDSPSRESCFLEYPQSRYSNRDDPEHLSAELLFGHRKVFAVGHGCAPEWEETDDGRASRIATVTLPTYEVSPVMPSDLEGLTLGMLELSNPEDSYALELCERLADGYKTWISDKEAETKELPSFLQGVAEDHLSQCRSCLSRIRRGIKLLEDDPVSRVAFSLMNRAMLMQHIHYTKSTDERRQWEKTSRGLNLEQPWSPPDYQSSERRWWPFQLAFILMTLRSIALLDNSDLEDREIVDLIWFPTGGGKTEAYLGLTAFTIFLRRLRDPANSGTTALMRYTLRLLTTQQFQRASSMICACEAIRRERPEELGKDTISIGLWVGGGVTPNKESAAVTAHRKLLEGERENPFIILSCPWCGAQMGPVNDGKRIKTKGYRRLSKPSRVRLICEDQDCEFSSDEGLPLLLIDEHIYGSPPSLVIGTVDKFALLPWYPTARSLFGIDRKGIDPPDLIIQDELHLISGPLGSMVGHYETVIEALSRRTSEDTFIPAKIIASTATISRAPQQVLGLYAKRKSCLFPPQGLRAGDSFFAEERTDQPGRVYAGVFASGLPSQTTTEIRVLSSLLEAPKFLEAGGPSTIDPYWTLMVYFNSIRELGHAATLIRADIGEYMKVMCARLDVKPADRAALRRFIKSDMELTSRVQNSEITEYMDRLFVKYTGQSCRAVDVCLATNMIQVGLDVPRLSLMAMVGQPKTTSEYIQASSRVGRIHPGLVVTILSPGKPRDRSHYERFRSYHQSLYRFVEPTSVTPFAAPVSERALHALVVTLARFWGDEKTQRFPDPPPNQVLEDRIRSTIMDRVGTVEPEESGRVERVLDRIMKDWRELPPRVYGSFSPKPEDVPLMYPSGRHPFEEWDERAYPTPWSMRNVDANCNARPIATYGDNDSASDPQDQE